VATYTAPPAMGATQSAKAQFSNEAAVRHATADTAPPQDAAWQPVNDTPDKLSTSPTNRSPPPAAPPGTAASSPDAATQFTKSTLKTDSDGDAAAAAAASGLAT
jgi:hypothetical protein